MCTAKQTAGKKLSNQYTQKSMGFLGGEGAVWFWFYVSLLKVGPESLHRST